MNTEAPKKSKLFLTSNDVSDLTGYSLRNSRNIMRHVRAHLDLSSHQSISIYAFSAVFNIPADILFIYINNKEFKTLPVTRDDLSRMDFSDLTALATHMKVLTAEEFEGVINQPRVPKINSKYSK